MDKHSVFFALLLSVTAFAFVRDTKGRETKFTYNELGNQISRTLPNNKTEYSGYDQLGRLTVHIDFNEQATGFFYNSRGLLEYKRYYAKDNNPGDGVNDNYPTTPTEEIGYTYDNLGRTKQIIESRGITEFYYDAESRTIAIKSPEGYVRYVYNDITGRKTQTRSYALTANLTTDVLALSNSDITRVEYTYDALGRLHETITRKRNSSLLTTPEVTITNYDIVGNRANQTLPNGITTSYTYNSKNQLTNLAHSNSLSSFVYTLLPNGMRKTATETLKYPDSTTKTQNITYSYDNLNRLVSETANDGSNGYDIDYVYDIAGNRLSRTVTANDQILTTEYQYDNYGADKLEREFHTGPIALVPSGNERYYAYANGSGISYRSSNGGKIGKVMAFMMGLPNEFTHYLFALVLVCVPASFFAPMFIHRGALGGVSPSRDRGRRVRYLFRQGLIILLAYLMFVTPTGLESIAYASSQYSQISTSDWATNKYVEYAYDNNGSCTRKTTKNTSNQVVEDVTYEYNLQNKLYKVTTDNQQGTTVAVAEYTYNDDGIRVKAYSYDRLRNGSTKSNEVTKTFLIDPQNHTGYAQILEESDGTNRTTYTIGDDVVSQSDYDGSTATTKHILYDGHGSTRQLTNGTGAVITDQVFNYDGYGVMVGYTGTSQTNLLYNGEYFDNDLQQYNLRARYYDPLNGRFNQLDPYMGNNQDPQSLHKYLYCHANPVNGTDADGLMFDCISTFLSTVLNKMMMAINVVFYWGIRSKVVSTIMAGLAVWNIYLLMTDPEALNIFIASSQANLNIMAGVLAMDVFVLRNMISSFRNVSRNVITLTYHSGDLSDFWKKANQLKSAAQKGGLVYVGDTTGIRSKASQKAYRKAMKNRITERFLSQGQNIDDATLSAEEYLQNRQADHIIDLQVSGALNNPNAEKNLQMLDTSVNTSIGKQLQLGAKNNNIQPGDVIDDIIINAPTEY